MEENGTNINFEEILDGEINDLWDIFFPKAVEKNEKVYKLDLTDQQKPRRYLRFLTM